MTSKYQDVPIVDLVSCGEGRTYFNGSTNKNEMGYNLKLILKYSNGRGQVEKKGASWETKGIGGETG